MFKTSNGIIAFRVSVRVRVRAPGPTVRCPMILITQINYVCVLACVHSLTCYVRVLVPPHQETSRRRAPVPSRRRRACNTFGTRPGSIPIRALALFEHRVFTTCHVAFIARTRVPRAAAAFRAHHDRTYARTHTHTRSNQIAHEITSPRGRTRAYCVSLFDVWAKLNIESQITASGVRSWRPAGILSNCKCIDCHLSPQVCEFQSDCTISLCVRHSRERAINQCKK